MSDDLEIVLRKSLDAVDRGRRWAILGVVALFLATAIALAALSALGASNSRGAASAAPPFKALFTSTATEMLFVGCCTIAVMFHVSRLAKAILRAIELRRGE